MLKLILRNQSQKLLQSGYLDMGKIITKRAADDSNYFNPTFCKRMIIFYVQEHTNT